MEVFPFAGKTKTMRNNNVLKMNITNKNLDLARAWVSYYNGEKIHIAVTLPVFSTIGGVMRAVLRLDLVGKRYPPLC